ncbi:MAG: hypothetical protein JWP44_3317 [Mucilaginibacter sp.]|nr:hypothetical protein [Mucilaginibacter sp.]
MLYLNAPSHSVLEGGQTPLLTAPYTNLSLRAQRGNRMPCRAALQSEEIASYPAITK